MLKAYREEPVLCAINARLIPPNPHYPDCMCELLLTQRTFYALEDNYYGTCSEHFSIPLGWITCMKRVVVTGEERTGGGSMSQGQFIATSVIGALGGLLVLPGKDGVRKAASEYLTVTYRDRATGESVLYFSELPRTGRKFIRVFDRLAAENM